MAIRKSDWNLVGTLSVIMMAAVMVYAIYRYPEMMDRGLPLSSIANITMDIVGMGICIILFITALFDHRMNVSTIYFMTMLTLECLILFWDFEAWTIDNDPDLVVYNKMMNYYIYGFVLITALTFWFFLKSILSTKDDLLGHIDILVLAVFLAGFLYVVTNPLTDVIFDVDPETGSYFRHDGYIFTLAAPFTMVLIFAYVTHRYVIGKKEKLALYSYTVLPILGAIVQTLESGLGIIYVAILMSMLMIYGNLYVERGHELARKDTELVEQKVSTMLSQIQPRFLFSALRSIENIEGNPEETRKAIADFSKYMEGNFNTLSQRSAIPFSKEMEHVMTYVELEKLRFKDKLEVRFDIRDCDFEIPALTLQMLVENAIKHGVTQKQEGGTVTLSTEEAQECHIITVIDDGVGFDTSQPPKDETRSHIGLSNVRQRVKEMTGGFLVIESEIGKGTKAVVVIPKKTFN